MTWTLRSISALAATAGLGAVLAAGPQTASPQAPAQQPSDLSTVIRGDASAPPRFAVPDFLALSSDAETVAVAKTIGQVLWDDLNFEREFALIPRDVYATIPAAKSLTDVPFDRWREVNADGVVAGTVQKGAAGILVQVRLFNVKTGQSAFGKEYSGSAGNPRSYAHTISDEIHKEQRGLRGVARTRLTFDSDRDGERMTGTVENRNVKEIYIADYDGAGQKRVTTGRSLNINPTWSPDGRSIAYASYRRGEPNIFISNIYQGTLEELTKKTGSNFLPSWSPDGTRVCFMSNRDGHMQLYIANRDGSNVRRLLNERGDDGAPTWSPNGTQIAFTSDRSGKPQIWVIDVDGLRQRKITSEDYADRPTWSPAPYNEIAFSARTGPGSDIKVIDLASGQVRQLTFGEGTNESPSWAPNGRHLAFTSTRSGKTQVFVMARDGKNLKQVTNMGNNYQPDWSK